MFELYRGITVQGCAEDTRLLSFFKVLNRFFSLIVRGLEIKGWGLHVDGFCMFSLSDLRSSKYKT